MSSYIFIDTHEFEGKKKAWLRKFSYAFLSPEFQTFKTIEVYVVSKRVCRIRRFLVLCMCHEVNVVLPGCVTFELCYQ